MGWIHAALHKFVSVAMELGKEQMDRRLCYEQKRRPVVACCRLIARPFQLLMKICLMKAKAWELSSTNLRCHGDSASENGILFCVVRVGVPGAKRKRPRREGKFDRTIVPVFTSGDRTYQLSLPPSICSAWDEGGSHSKRRGVYMIGRHGVYRLGEVVYGCGDVDLMGN